MRNVELSPDGRAKIEALDSYLQDELRDGRAIEVLIATRWLGEIVNVRSKEAARAATASEASWTDVGSALGMTRQAAHEKFRARVGDDLDKARRKLDRAEAAAHAKITKRAERGRKQLDDAAPFSSKVDSARRRLDDWEVGQHDKVDRKMEKARRTIAQAEQEGLGKRRT